jgi:hypothetical protein
MKRLALIVLVVCFGTAALAISHTSASYAVPAEVFGSTGVQQASGSYAGIGAINGLVLGVANSSSYTMREGFMPQAFPGLSVLVTSINPDSAYNTGRVNITKIAGANFQAGAAVKLAMTGEADIVATNISINGTGEIACLFDLMGKKTGRWDLVVTNPDGNGGTLPAAFNIRTWSDTKLVLNTPNPFNPPFETTTIMYKLDQDAAVTVAIFSTTAELVWKRNYSAGTSGGQAGDNTIVWTGLSDFNEYVSNGVYLLHVIDRSSGRTLARGKIAVIRK